MFLRLCFALLHSTNLILLTESAEIKPFEVPLKLSGLTDLCGQISLGRTKDGQPSQILTAMFDTATCHLWVVSKELKKEGNFRPYDGTTSEKYTSQKTPLVEPFSGGTLEGYMSTDVVRIGLGEESIILEDQMIGEATKLSSNLEDMLFEHHDALFGLDLISPDLLAGNPETPLLYMEKVYGKVPSFGYYINRRFADQSRLVFGATDAQYSTTSPSFHPVVKRDGYYRGWNVKINRFDVKFSELPVKDVSVGQAQFARIMTRSNSLFMGPKNVMNSINEEIFSMYHFDDFWLDRSNDGLYIFPCAHILDMWFELPDVSVYIDETQFTFLPQEYLAKTVDEDKCQSMFVGIDVPHLILGSPFITKFYTRFNYEQKEVQFARAKQEGEEVQLNKMTPEEKLIGKIALKTEIAKPTAE